MKRKITTLFFILFTFIYCCNAASVDTISIFSETMNKDIKTVVIRPEGVVDKPLATLYLLHGYSGNYSNWVEKVPQIKALADQYNYVIVCPDGGYGSWYWDSPIDESYRYETFISKELVFAIESKYNVIKDRAGRAITGLSMGGHGALYLAIQHQDVFGAAGSTSGGVDIRAFPNNWEIIKRLGAYHDNKDRWESHTVINMLHLIKPNSLKIIIDCGYSDFFYKVNQNLHEELLYLNIPHTYLNFPGAHNWAYWSQSIVYQMAFFDLYFKGNLLNK